MVTRRPARAACDKIGRGLKAAPDKDSSLLNLITRVSHGDANFCRFMESRLYLVGSKPATFACRHRENRV